MRYALPILSVLALVGSASAPSGASGFEPGALRRLPATAAEELPSRVEPAAYEYGMAPEPGPIVPPDVSPASLSSASIADDEQYFTMDELRAEMKKLAWGKGDFRIVPYGFLWATMAYDSDRTFPGAYTLFVPSRAVEGEDAFIIDVRRTRLGLNVDGPQIPWLDCAESRAQVEIDFQGDFFVVENKASVLLRHAYWEAKNDRFRILVGQYWDLISPLYPNTLMYSVGWAGGNMGYRRAQFRLERYFTVSDHLRLAAQMSLNQDIVSDFAATAAIEGEPADWPVIQGRLGATLGPRGENCRPIDLGVFGHVGEQEFDFTTNSGPPFFFPPADDVRIATWSFGVDVRIPITERFGFQGEYFTGRNLGTFLGGIAQGVCPCRREGIRATGGWFEFWYDWTSRWHSHVGFGIDDPNDNDLVLGRRYNHFLFGNVHFDVTEKLNAGLELSSWKTLHTGAAVGDPDLPPGESVRLEFVTRYGF